MEDVSKANRAQIIIVAAFLLSIGIILLAVILNSLIFAQDLSSSDRGLDERQVNDVSLIGVEAAKKGAVGAGDYVPTDAKSELEKFIEYVESNARNHSYDRYISVDFDENPSTTPAWIIGQKEVGDFQDSNSNSTWTMIEFNGNGIGDYLVNGGTPVFILNITSTPDSGEFIINTTSNNSDEVGGVTEGSWDLRINETHLSISYWEVDLGNLTKTLNPVTTVEINDSYINSTGYARIDILNESINGVDYSGDFDVDKFNKSELIVFEQSHEIEGTYQLRLEGIDSHEAYIYGPCNPNPNGCAGDGSREVHAIGIVHRVEDYGVTYLDQYGNLERTVNFTTEQDWLELEGVP